jgi:hypothetical protein
MHPAPERSTARASSLARCARSELAARSLPSLLLWLSSALAGCGQKLVVGQWTCSEDGTATAIPAASDPVTLPWSTSFENGFCDYSQVGGFCVQDQLAEYKIVQAPVHSGQYAAEFSIASATSAGGYQARCVRQGTLPTTAYYGAWYYVPALATTTANWNLMHFSRGDTQPGSTQDGLWDVSLINTASGGLQLSVYDFLNVTPRTPLNAPQIPIGAWFHIQFYLKRAADATGSIALYQDGQQLLAVSGLVTDNSSWAQWYVGNLALGLMPPDSIVYVDDVTIGPTL